MNNITPLTAQQVFDAAVDGIAAQGFKRSVDEHNACLYRGPDGLKCAVGHSIPDELYLPEIEGLTAYGLVDCLPLARLYINVRDSGLLSDLQRLHDDNDDCRKNLLDVKTFLDEAQALASKHGLVYTEPK